MNCKSLLLLLSLHAPLVSGQELHLFEVLDRDADFPPTPQQSTAVAGAGAVPAFTLRSLSRFADSYEAVLIDRAGQPVRASWRQGEAAALAGGYLVQSGAPGSVMLQHPANDPCMPAQDTGVVCDDNALARLTLVTALPLAANATAARVQADPGQEATPAAPAQRSGQPGTTPATPFETRIFSTRELTPEQVRELRAARGAPVNELRLRRDEDAGGNADDEPFRPQGMRLVTPAFGGRRSR